jgi:cell division protein FtsB
MKDKIKTIFSKILNIDTRSIGLIAIMVVAISVTYSSVKIIQKNYQLQQEITKLSQQNALQEQKNKNQELKNQYYKTDAYLDIATRRYFGKALPGETVVLVPKEIAMRYTTEQPKNKEIIKIDTSPRFIQNWKSWVKLFTGQELSTP